MDWLDELVIDADDNTWFRWMFQRQTKGQTGGQMNQMSGDGDVMYIGTNQSKTRQKRRFEVQSRTKTVAQNVLKAVRRRRGSAAVQGALPQQRVQSQTMTTVGQQPIGLLPAQQRMTPNRGGRGRGRGLPPQHVSPAMNIPPMNMGNQSGIRQISRANSVRNLNMQFQQQRTSQRPITQTTPVKPAPPGGESPIISLQSGIGLKPLVTNVALQQQLNSCNIKLEQLEPIVGSSLSFEQLELFSGATSYEKIELKYSEQLNVDATSTNKNETCVEQLSESGLSTAPPPAVSSCDNALEQLESIVNSAPSEQLQMSSSATGGENIELKYSEQLNVDATSTNKNETYVEQSSESGLSTPLPPAVSSCDKLEQLEPIVGSSPSFEQLELFNGAISYEKMELKCSEQLNVDATSTNKNETYVEQPSESGLSTAPPPAVSSCDNALEQLELIVSSSPLFEQFELFSGAANPEKVELEYREQLIDSITADINTLPFKQSHHHQGCREGVRNKLTKIELVEISSGSDDDEDYSTQPIVQQQQQQQQQHDRQPGTSGDFDQSGVGYVVPNELLLSVELSRLPAGTVDAQGRLKIATGCKGGNIDPGSTGQKPFKCPTCEKRFTVKSSCDWHMKLVHNVCLNSHVSSEKFKAGNSKKYKCQFCDKWFRFPTLRKTHERIHTSEKPFKCSICEKHFSRSSNRNIHMKQVHTDERPFKCQFCDKRMITRSHLKLHERIHTGEKPFKCSICEKHFSRSSNRNIHMKQVHTDERPFKCQFCDQGFNFLSDIKRHERIHTGEKPFKCSICEKHFSRSASCNLHIKLVHTEERPFKCPTCEKCFVLKAHCKQHVKLVHSDERPFKCQFCDKRMKYHNDMTRHERIHTGEKPFKCSICEKHFSRSASCNLHMKLVHTEERPFKCPTCEKCFVLKAQCKQHVKLVHSDERPFKCQFCDKRMITRSHLKLHERIHTGEKPFKCSICEKHFSRSASCNLHMKLVHTEERPFKCPTCEKCFVLKAHCKQHVKLVHSDERPFKCQFCDKRMITRSHLKLHERIHTGEKPFKCSICEKHFSQSSTCKNHMKLVHTNERPFKCPTCEKCFALKSHCQAHMKRVHTDERPFKCQFCDNGMKTSSQLKQHERIHTGEKRFKCSICEKHFKQTSHRDVHMKQVHSDERPFKCQFCDKGMKTSFYLKLHEHMHTGEKPFKCPMCEKCFTWKTSCKKHMKRVHTDERPFKCRFCDKRMKTSSYLKQHERIHTGEKLFKCPMCEKCFSWKTSCKQHMKRVHTDERPFKCPTCEKCFVLKSRCQAHMKLVHSDERPFKCRFCDKRMKTSSYLKQHERIHTGEKPFKCPTCEKCFAVQSQCNLHMKRVHTGERPFKCQFCDKRMKTNYLLKQHERIHTGENRLNVRYARNILRRHQAVKST
ncbi:uncharacterized protein LOC141909516 isoform X2 [Tubulanus polymorphus]|uniref:uncharacterized protein LOC141909516 isoform X2 n=1 Tax=Tubulanus polymorphus TaxID=672921 RepID=UPI003DA60ADF